MIPQKSARSREAGLLDECAQRSFAALRACPERSEGMTAKGFVILSAAKDLWWTSEESPVGYDISCNNKRNEIQ